MKEKIYELKSSKKLIITSNYIAITSKKASDFQEMKKWAEMISLKKDFVKVEKKDLIKIRYNESGEQIKIQFSSLKKLDDSFTIIPRKEADFLEIGKDLHEVMELEKMEKTENRAKFIGSSLVEVILGVLTSGFLIYFTMQKQAGEEFTMSSGRRQGIMRMALGFVDTIGIPATIALTVILIGLIIYRAIKRFKKPSMEIILERKKTEHNKA